MEKNGQGQAGPNQESGTVFSFPIKVEKVHLFQTLVLLSQAHGYTVEFEEHVGLEPAFHHGVLES